MGCASHILFMFNISDFSNQMSLPAATLPATCYLQPQPKSNKKSCVFFLNIAALFGKKTSCSWISYTDWLRPLMFHLLIIEANRYALRPCSQHPHPPHHASSSPTSSSSFIPKRLLYNPRLLQRFCPWASTTRRHQHAEGTVACSHHTCILPAWIDNLALNKFYNIPALTDSIV